MPNLKLKKEFEAVLSNYQASKQAVTILQQTPLVLMAGLTASGRNTLIEHLAKDGVCMFVLSDTTRPPRMVHGEVEKNGGPYWFRSEQEVLEGLKRGDYLEAAIVHNQQVSGLSIREIEKAHAADKTAITEVTPDGIDTYKQLKPDTICIFVLPPSYEVWLERLNRRGEMTVEELTKRTASALEELDHLLTHPEYKVVINDEFDHTLAQVRGIIENDQYPKSEQEDGLRLARQIKARIEAASAREA